MAYRAALLNFSKGCISPELEARFDLPAYQAGLRVADNVVIRRTGGIQKRMGTRFVAQALGTSSRLIPFQFSDEQAYALEFAQALMRPLALGGAVLEEDLKVIAITKGAETTINVPFHDYDVGDQVYLSSDDPVTFGMTEILDRFLTVTQVVDADNFKVNVDSTSFEDFGSDTGTVRVGAPAAPPAPPVVPAPITPPEPPPVSSGGSGGYNNGDWNPQGSNGVYL